MFNGRIINDLIENKRAKKIDVYNYAGITKSTLDNIIKGTSIPNCNSVSSDILLNESKKEVEHLKELLAEKERLIQVLMKK